MAKYYSFKVKGTVEFLTMQEAIDLNADNLKERFEEIKANSSNKRMIKDGFEGGFQGNINEVIYNRSDYDKRLRELNLVEMGYTPIVEAPEQFSKYCQSEEFALAVNAETPLTGQEIEGIKDGSYYEDAKEIVVV